MKHPSLFRLRQTIPLALICLTALGFTACKTGRSGADSPSADTPAPKSSQTPKTTQPKKNRMPDYGVRKDLFGKTETGEEVDIYTLVNKHGLVARITTYGAMLTEMHVPDRNGELGDVVLGFDNLQQYLDGHPYFGCTTGRVANRIAKGRFTLNGKTYNLAINNPPNHLHGGDKGLDKRIWKAVPVNSPEGPAVRFSYLSPDGEEGYPGNLWIVVTYTLTTGNELKIDYEATTDRDTPINLTNHAYWNLEDAGRTDVLDHQLQILADHYTPVDSTLIPTGEIAPVAGTVMDFSEPQSIGSRIGQLPGDPGAGNPGGYDHNYVLRQRTTQEPRLAARVHDPNSGRLLEIFTTEPGIQLYSGNFLDGTLTGKYGHTYQKHHALCLETQHFPDSINQPNFPSVILKAGDTYRQITVHRFSVSDTW